MLPLITVFTECKIKAGDDGFFWQAFQMLLGESKSSSRKIPLILSLRIFIQSCLLSVHNNFSIAGFVHLRLVDFFRFLNHTKFSIQI